jgi:glycosyltransferase involved in cell wall biosynthesis
MKIFFMCTHCNQGTGYARSANKITNFLADQPGVEVVYYAFQNYPGQDVKDRYINPKIKFIDAIVEDPDSPKGFGDNGILPHFEKEKPDVLFLYNDLPVCVSILKHIEQSSYKTFKKIAYLDIVFPWEDIDRYDFIKSQLDHCYVFLNCWKKHLVEDLGFEENKVSVLPLGVDLDKFHIISPDLAKESIGMKPEDFVVLNMNRNSYRKQWNVTITAFLSFLKKQNMNPNIKLFCGCLLKTPDGYDIRKCIATEALKLGMEQSVVLEKHIYSNPMAMQDTDERINIIYNACDVGINTCHGEGFGLTNVEHGALGKPQVVPNVPAIKETLGNHAFFVEPKVWSQVSCFEDHGGDIALYDPEDFAVALNNIYIHKVSARSINKHIKNTYNWSSTYEALKTLLP